MREPYERLLSEYMFRVGWPPERLRERKWYCYHRRRFDRWMHGGTDAPRDPCHLIAQHAYVSRQFAWASQLPRRGREASDAAAAGPDLPDALSEDPRRNAAASPGRSCNIVLRFERLQKELRALARWSGLEDIGIDFRDMMRDHNTRLHGKGACPGQPLRARDLLSRSGRALAMARYHDDFRLFGYDMGGEEAAGVGGATCADGGRASLGWGGLVL